MMSTLRHTRTGTPGQPLPGQPWTPPVNSKTPPPWSPDHAYHYPFRKYAKDLILWSLSTDVPTNQQAPAAVLQLSGEARSLADELDVQALINGAVEDHGDGQGATYKAGLAILIFRLGERFSELEVEYTIRVITEFMHFSRQAGESIDQALTRFDILNHRADTTAQLGIPPAFLAYQMLMSLHIYRSE